MSHAAEDDLIRRCRQGDTEAWDDLFDRHYAPTGRFVFQLAHNFTWEDVEEIQQEVFLSVIRNLDSFRGQCQFQTWVFRIAANKARDFWQKQQAAKRGGGQAPISLQATADEDSPPIDPPSTAPGPDAVLQAGERLTLLKAALDRLEEPCREIIELRYFGDLGHEEIGKSLKLNPKTVSSRLSKCLDRLEVIAMKVFSKGGGDGISV